MTPAQLLSSIPDENLKEAVREAIVWTKTGKLPGATLRAIADRLNREAGLSEDGLLRDTDTLVCREAARRFAV